MGGFRAAELNIYVLDIESIRSRGKRAANVYVFLRYTWLLNCRATEPSVNIPLSWPISWAVRLRNRVQPSLYVYYRA